MFPRLTNIESNIASKIKNTSTLSYGKLNCFVRLISGTGDGLIMVSNPDWKLFEAAGARGGFTLYGGPDRSGTVGIDWKGKPVNTNDNTSGQIIDTPFKPTPIVTSINIKEGKDQISRHCDLKFTAFTLAQVELLQKYFMEPGHSLCVEYGWNTAEGYSGLVSVAQPNSLPAIIGERNLDYNSLHTTRVQTNGEYDSFFGFIVGGSVTSNGDAFDVSIKLRGAPGLPTYLQSQFNIKQQAADGTINNNDAEPPFDISELNLEAADQMAERRFKMLFNFLPKTRRTTEVKNLLFRTNDNIWTGNDFVNFDPVIDNQISIFRDGRPSPAVSGDGTLDNASTSGASGTDASSGTSSDKGSNAAAQSGQEKKTQDAKGKATRSDAPGLQWERLNNIANEYVKASGDENNAAWKAYVTTWKVTAAEISEVKSTRIEIQKVNTSGQVVGATGPVQVPFVAQGPVGQTNPLVGNLNLATFNVYKVKAVPAPPIPDGTPGQVGEGGGFTVGIAEGAIGPTEIMLDGGIPLPKEKLFSKNRYIRFAKAVQILNANTSLKSLLIGGKIPVNVVIDIKEAKIGAFYGIYSCKPEALLIPGWMPNFSKFFMEANLQELSTEERLIDNSIGTISFAQKDALAQDGYVEDAYRWGLLEHLYINFDLFKRELEKPNQAMKDVLQTLLNEMSTAVNGFWNFQIAEKSTKINGHNTTVYTVYDENWVGKYNSSAAPVEFIHSGERSKFLEANLNIEIPGSMMNKIITQRLALVSNPDQQEIALGGAFSSSRDRFFTKYLDTGEGSAATSGGSGTSGASGTSTTSTQLGGDNPSDFAKEFNKINQSPLSEEQKKLAADHDALLATLKEQANSAKEGADMINGRSYKNPQLQALHEKLIEANQKVAAEYFHVTDEGKKEYEDAKKAQTAVQAEFDALKTKLEGASAAAEQALKDAEAKSAELLEQFKAQGSTNVSNNLDVIDVVPNPAENTITQDDLVNFLTDINVFKQKFKVYCCRDQNFLNILKVNNINPKLKTIKIGKDDAGNPTVSIGGSLTPPLPIKYSFKIIGRSGIRRGDTFNIIGIPAKYKNHGFFQVTEIEHTIDNMKWVTRVQGEYRQLQ